MAVPNIFLQYQTNPYTAARNSVWLRDYMGLLGATVCAELAE